MLTFLGIEIDSLAMELRLPQDKLARLKGEIAGWQSNGLAQNAKCNP